VSSSAYLKVAMLMGFVCVVVLFFLVYRLLELPARGQSTVSLQPASTGATGANAASTPAATPSATAAPAGTGTSAVALQYPNVHSAPATSAPVLGVLSRGTQVDVVGKSSDGAWLQIRYPSGPSGVGWVSTSLMSVSESMASIPVAAAP
jgi:uncharacterized protein YraI